MGKVKSFDDSPISPVKGWKHYYIVQDADRRVRDFLEGLQYKGYLIGIQVSYVLLESDEPSDEIGVEYKMGFGVIDLPPSKKKKNPLTQEFMMDLYQRIQRLIENNTDVPGSYSVKLDVSISGSWYSSSIKCGILKAGQCAGNPQNGGAVCPTGASRLLFDSGDGNGYMCIHVAC